MTTSKFYYIIASTRSRNSFGGIGKINLVLMDEKEIINIASNQATRRGESLERHAGIEFLGVNPDGDFESFEPSRSWEEGEELEAAISEFTEDGYVYEIFECKTERNEFVARAADFDLENEATEFLIK